MKQAMSLRDKLLKSLAEFGAATEYDLILSISTRSRPTKADLLAELNELQIAGIVRCRETARAGAKTRTLWELIA